MQNSIWINNSNVTSNLIFLKCKFDKRFIKGSLGKSKPFSLQIQDSKLGFNAPPTNSDQLLPLHLKEHQFDRFYSLFP
jgi:hypothetical protein